MKLKLDLEPKLFVLTVKNLKYIEADSHSKPIIVKEGMEFDHYREYLPTDDARLIDWKASLRSNRLQSKVFQEDKAISINFIVDTSLNMLYGTGEKLKLEYAFEMLSSLCYGILNNGDRVSLTLFNDEVVGSLPLLEGIRNFGFIQNMLYNFDKAGGMPNLIEPIFQCNQNPWNFNAVIIISDFFGADSDFAKYLATIPETQSVIGIMVNDPSEISIPEDVGLVSLKDPYRGEIMLLDSGKVAEEYNQKNLERIESIKRAFDRAGGDFMLLRTDQDFVDPLMEFLEYRISGGMRK